MSADTEYRYNRLTWPEMKEAIAAQKVVLLPVGSTEQHGPHLPLDVDSFLVETVCLEVGKRAPDRVLVLPTVSYGLNLHHIDFPGTVHIEPEHFISFCLDITKSVAYHGFTKIVVVNGHGSNSCLADLVARKTTLETPALCCATNYFAFGTEAFAAVQETPVIAHADEFETSLYLHIAPERVRVDQIVEGNDVVGKYVSSDSTTPYVRFSDYWGRWTNKGVHGYPRAATAEKGKLIFESTISRMVEFVDEWRAWPISERSDQHDGTAQKQVRW